MSGSAVYVNLKEFDYGKVIFTQGSASDCMYEVQKGKVGIFLDYGTEKEKKLAEIGPDRIFGEMGMVEGVPRSASAVSLNEFTVVAVITWDVLSFYFKTKPARVVQILQQTSDRLRLMTKVNSEFEKGVRTSIKAIEDGCSRPEALEGLRNAVLDMEMSIKANK